MCEQAGQEAIYASLNVSRDLVPEITARSSSLWKPLSGIVVRGYASVLPDVPLMFPG
jgi:hypothetical protein